MGKLQQARLRCAMRFIVDILWYKYRVKVFHDFSGKLMGQNAVNTSCRQQLGSSSLPLSGLLDVFCNSPKIFRHSFQSLFFCGFFLVQQPNAVFLIHENYSEPISLALLAEKLRVSESYLSSLFHKETGESYIKFLTRVRMEKAAELLRTERSLKVYEVSHRVGYFNAKHFNHVFKQWMGVSPNQYQLCYFDQP